MSTAIPITMNELLEHCYTAIENFLKSHQPQSIKDLAENMVYDVYISHRLANAIGKAHRRGSTRGQKAGGPKGFLVNHAMEFSDVLMSHASPEERFDTVAHELAHLLDYELRGRSGHDRTWRAIHHSMGGNGKRCHNLDKSSLPLNNRPYKVTNNYTGEVKYYRQKEIDRLIVTIGCENIDRPGTYTVVNTRTKKNLTPHRNRVK